jgi:hypothetical protein
MSTNTHFSARPLNQRYQVEQITPAQDTLDAARLRPMRKPTKPPLDIVRKVVAMWGDELHSGGGIVRNRQGNI